MSNIGYIFLFGCCFALSAGITLWLISAIQEKTSIIEGLI